MAAMFSIKLGGLDGKATSMSLDEAGRRHVEMHAKLVRTRDTYDLDFATWGSLLEQIKAQLPPRESWITFLHRADVHEKTAQRAMSIARDCSDDGVFNPEKVAAVMNARRNGRVLKSASRPVGTPRSGEGKTTRESFCVPQKRGGYVIGGVEVDEADIFGGGVGGAGNQTAAAAAGAKGAPAAGRVGHVAEHHGRAGRDHPFVGVVPGSGERLDAIERSGRDPVTPTHIARGRRRDVGGQATLVELFAAAERFAEWVLVQVRGGSADETMVRAFMELAERFAPGTAQIGGA